MTVGTPETPSDMGADSGVVHAPGVNEGAYAIAELLDQVLRAVVQGFTNAGVPLPTRRYWTTGTPTSDCEQVVVAFRQAYYGPPGDEASEPQRCDGPRSANIEVHVTRCVPTPKGSRGTPPSPQEIQESATIRLVDSWLLLDFAPILDQWNGFGMPGGLGVIGTVETGESKGGFQSTILTLTMATP